MAESVAHSIICPIIIGRDAERAAMAQLLERVCNERGQTLLVTGEAGIGKSRLVAELVQEARQKGFTFIEGRAFETDAAIPCALLVEMLRSSLANEPGAQILQELGPSATELVRLLPELRSRLAMSDPVVAGGSEPEKRRLFEALVHCFVRPSQTTLMVVEDAHWCDATSLEFLLLLARKIVPHPILLVITYRNDETGTALAHLLASLDREHLASEMALARLTKQQTAAMLRAIFTLPRPTQEDFLDALYTLTDGNPFFIEEVLKSCVAAGDIFQIGGQWGRKLLSQLHIPRTIQLAVRLRVAQLSPAAQRLLKIAAVAGQRFDFVLLQQVSGQDERVMLALLKELISAQLVIEEPADRFAFRHALTRQAVYLDLLARERRHLHLAVAEALEQWQQSSLEEENDTRLPELAYHYYTAGEWGKTLYYASRAGQRAQALFTPRVAVEHLSHALQAIQHLTKPDKGESQEYDAGAIYRARGQAYETLGEFEAARADLEQALALARLRHDSRAEWQGLLDLGFLWTSRDFERAGHYFQQSLAVARAGEDAIGLAQSLNRLGNLYVNLDEPHLGRRYHMEALAVFQTLDDPAGLAATLDLLAGASHLAGDPEQSQIYYEQATQLQRHLKEQRGLASSLTWLAFRGAITLNLLAPAAPLSECAQRVQEALHLARRIQWRPGEAFAMIALGFCCAAQGHYAEALALVEDATGLAQELDHRWDTVGYIALGAIYLDLGIPSRAQEYFERARAVTQQHGLRFSLRISTALLAATYLLQHEIPRVHEMLATAFGEAPPAFPPDGEHPPTMAQRLYWLVCAEAALHEKQAGVALALADQLLATTGEVGSHAERAVARLLFLRGEALLALQHTDEAEQSLRDALQAAHLQGARPLLWRIHGKLGSLYRALGQREASEQHFVAARDLVDLLANTLPAPQLRRQFLDFALAQLPAPVVTTPLRARKLTFDGLTAREVEVARFIRQGKSDREIAEALSLSIRTVSTHVGNILSKLDFSSRSQIAAWATTKGI